ncbi:pilus assembly protein N-terminal domain-containing protein [Paludibacterium purpuratum]|uniref:Type IV pilus biogenesis and competence protein PilQ n=1 Tax=Paludibacterium purpuratum TaxID=1144873 RepID=A0A4R7B6H4_9NEIS|nr:pilus assembly protein N-terminal domain-containing protein [Paludibacterium purpuratum]TDR80248.1 pilus assembly protein CpaC [Paludibacterium purpuratum]
MFAKKNIPLTTASLCLGLFSAMTAAHAEPVGSSAGAASAPTATIKSVPAAKAASQSEAISASFKKPIVLPVGKKTASEGAAASSKVRKPGAKGAVKTNKAASAPSDAHAKTDSSGAVAQSGPIKSIGGGMNNASAPTQAKSAGKLAKGQGGKMGKIQDLADGPNPNPLPFDVSSGKGKGKAGSKMVPARLAARSLPFGMGAGMQQAELDEDGNLSLAVGTGKLLHLPGVARTVFVSDPNVADVQVPNANEVFVLGKKVGTTTVFALDGAGLPLLQRSVVVSHNVAELQKVLTQRFPSLHLDLKSAPGSLMVSGTVNRAEDIAAITETLKPYIGDKENLVNRLSLNSPTQVNLHVRMVEVSRTVLQQIGVNWSALGQNAGLFSGRAAFKPGSLGQPDTAFLPANSGFMGLLRDSNGRGTSVIDMLDRESLLTTLAEPNLTTISGEPASFLAGGEYPIPVPQGGDSNTITVQYKDFGVGLKFTPTVQASDRITLKVNPEVSELDPANSITLLGTTIPALTVRRLDTTVELASGQSLVLGGLLQDNSRDVLSQMPGLGRLPVLGKLFSSTDYQHNKTELVVIVTPYLVRPVGPGTLQTPLDSLINPSDVEGALQRQAKLDPYDSATPHLAGNSGHVY